MSAETEQRAKISRLLDHVSEIPPLPSVTARILEVAENPASSAQDLTEIISRDPSLTTQLLRAANSAFYGFPQQIGTVYLAVVILGFNMVRTIALGTGVLKLFRAKNAAASLLNPAMFWEHSLKCGIACKLLATTYKYYVAGEAFTAGLLHDLGKIVLAHYSTPQFEKVADYRREKGCPALEAEQAVLGFTQADVGGYLLERWSLPLSIVEAVAFHHAPGMSKNARDLASITHVANHLSHLHSFRKGTESEQPAPDSAHWGTLPHPVDQEATLRELLRKLDEELGKAQSFIRILKGEDGAK